MSVQEGRHEYSRLWSKNGQQPQQHVCQIMVTCAKGNNCVNLIFCIPITIHKHRKFSAQGSKLYELKVNENRYTGDIISGWNTGE